VSSTEHAVNSNDRSTKESTTTKLIKEPCGGALGDDSTTVEDENIVEDQELINSYEFVEADYNSYTDVASTVTAGSYTDSEFSEREEELIVAFENSDAKKDNDRGTKKERVIEAMTKTADKSDGKDNRKEVVGNTMVICLLLSECQSINEDRMCG
jgi:hypothetical protein